MTAMGLVCPVNGDALHHADGVMRSDGGVVYPQSGGVPVIVQGVSVRAEEVPPAPAVISALMEALGAQPSHRPDIEQAFSQRFIFAEDWIQTEADQFLHRVGASDAAVQRALLNDKAPPEPDRAPASDPLATPPRTSLLAKLRKALTSGPGRDPRRADAQGQYRPHLSCIFTLRKVRQATRFSVNLRLEIVAHRPSLRRVLAR
jgi:hypothetical protein